MSSSEHRYVLSTALPSVGAQRLHDVVAFLAPSTQGRLAQSGFGEGWRCLEVGAGGGVARWMAERVGARGKITTTDPAPRVLGRHPAGAAPAASRSEPAPQPPRA